MNNKRIVIAALIVAALVAGCSAGSGSNAGTATRTMKEVVPPSHCRIVGTIVEALNDRDADPNSACGKAPCMATVRIDSVLGYGSGFTTRLATGSTAVIRFQLTLAPTTPDLFPNMTERYPGLSEGSIFRADVEQRTAPGKNPPFEYSVFTYSLIKH